MIDSDLQSEGAGSRRLPVFISSTFRDMDYERDVIQRIVLPTVNETLRERGDRVIVYAVDLRWGIDVDEGLTPEARDRIILDVCAGEVRRCRPLFIGLVGGRYGWVAPAEIEHAARLQAGVADAGFPLSTMALEILTATTAAVDDGVEPILLARELSDDDRAAADAQRARHDPPGSREAELLSCFMGHLASCGHPPRIYASQWRTPIGSPVARLESDEFAPLLVDALVQAVGRVVTERLAPASWLDREVELQRAAAADLAAGFVGRDEDADLIDHFWDLKFLGRDVGDDSGNPLWKLRYQQREQTLAIVGPSGIGKSALLAHAAVALQCQFIVGFYGGRAYVQVGLTVATRQLPVCLLVLLAQLDPERAGRIAAESQPGTLRLSDVLDAWRARLIASEGPAWPLVVVDGLDRFEGEETESIPLAWMPLWLGDRVRFLVSTTDGGIASVLEVRPSTFVHRIGPLEAQDARALVRQMVEAHHRTLPPRVIDMLCARSQMPRWLVVATDLLLKLTADDYLITEARQDGLAGDRAIDAMLAEVAADLPSDLDDLHAEALERLAEFSPLWVAMVLWLMRVSMLGGLRTDDLISVISSMGHQPTRADMALVQTLLSEHIAVHDDIWDWAHDSAAEGLGLLVRRETEDPESDLLTPYRHALVAHLVSLPLTDPVRESTLLAVLWDINARGLVSTALDRPDLSSGAALDKFAIWLSLVVHWEILTSDGLAADLLDSADSDRERLTVAGFLAGYLAPALTGPAQARVLDRMRAAVETIEPSLSNRFGMTAAELIQLIGVMAYDPLDPAVDSGASWQQDFGRWSTLLASGACGIADAPSTEPEEPASAYADWIRVTVETDIVCEAAAAVAADLRPSDPADHAHVRRRLEHARSAAARISERPLHDTWRAWLDLRLLTCVRAAALAWPEAGFSPDDRDLGLTQDFVDRARGGLASVTLLAVLSRFRALEEVQALDESSTTDEEAAAAHRALEILDVALWELAICRTIVGDHPSIESEWIRCGAMHEGLLDACDQDAAACRSGFRLCMSPLAVSLMGWDNFLEHASRVLMRCGDTAPVRLDVRPLIARLRDEIDARREADPWLLDNDDVIAEAGLLVSALYAGSRFGEPDLARAAATRAWALEDAGRLSLGGEFTVCEFVRAFAADAEDELTELAEDPDVVVTMLDADERSEVTAHVRLIQDLRSSVVSREGATGEDLVGLALCAAMLYATTTHPEVAGDARHLLATAPGADDERLRRLRAATDLLLA